MTFTVQRTTDLVDPDSWSVTSYQIINSVEGDGADVLTLRVLPAVGAAPTQSFRLAIN